MTNIPLAAVVPPLCVLVFVLGLATRPSGTGSGAQAQSLAEDKAIRLAGIGKPNPRTTSQIVDDPAVMIVEVARNGHATVRQVAVWPTGVVGPNSPLLQALRNCADGMSTEGGVPSGFVVFRVDKDAPFSSVEPLVKMCKSVRIWKVYFDVVDQGTLGEGGYSFYLLLRKPEQAVEDVTVSDLEGDGFLVAGRSCTTKEELQRLIGEMPEKADSITRLLLDGGMAWQGVLRLMEWCGAESHAFWDGGILLE